MGLRCWPGCLAVIVNPRSPNYGKSVTVVRPWRGERSTRGCPYPDDGEHAWIVEGRDLWLHCGGIAEEPTPWVRARDRWLRPITPPPGTEVETVADVLEAARSAPVEA